MLRRALVALLVYGLVFQPFLQLTRPASAAEPVVPLARLAAEVAATAGEPEEPANLRVPEAALPTHEAASAEELGLAVSVAFADSTTASADFPTPWQGSPNVVYLGAGAPVNAGAIRFENLSAAPLQIDSVEVDLQRDNAHFALWPAFTIPVGGAAVLTQTAPGNFDTSAYPIAPCGGALAPDETRIPKVVLTFGDSSLTLLDSAHILDTGGFDASCRGNESLQWRQIDGIGLEAPSGALLLGRAGTSGSGGSPITLDALLQDPDGKPLSNVRVDFRIVSGPNAGATGQGVTDRRGLSHFTYTGMTQGADVVRATVANAGGATVQSNDVTVTWESAACGPDVPLPPSGEATLLYIGGDRVQYSDSLELAALLSDAPGLPVPGQTLEFTFGDTTLEATTDATGIARVAVTASVGPAEVPVSVDFGGAGELPPLRATDTVTVEREDVLLEYTASSLLGTAAAQPLSALLRDPDSLEPIPDRTITFTVGNVTATAVTDADGVAATTLTLGEEAMSGPSSLTASFAGDLYYKPAFRTVAVTLYLSTSFVVWGGNVGGLQLGQRVSFWGAQWDKQVKEGEYGTNASFKGFADPVGEVHLCQPEATLHTLTPGCWVSKGGQSFPPPVAVPAYIEVVVSTAIDKKGKDIFGNIAAAAVVKVDPEPAYGPVPGKPGYGVVVAVIEDGGVFPAPARITAEQTQPRTVLPDELITLSAGLTNTSTTTAATEVVLAETLDGLTPDTVSQTVGTIRPGASETVVFQAVTPAIPVRQSGESRVDYLRRLAGLDGRVFTAAGEVTFTDENDQLYLPVEVSSRSVLAIPVLTLGLSGPAVASPGAPAPYRVSVTNIGSAVAAATVSLTLPDGSEEAFEVPDLAAGSTFAQIVTYTPPAIAPKGETETTEDYLARLAEADGELLTASADVSWSDANGNPYGDVGERIFTSRIRVPILALTAETPATLLPTEVADLDLEVQNIGGCTAVLSNLTVTNPDGTVTELDPFVLAPEDSTTIPATWRVPEVPKRDEDGETDAQYQARLESVDGSDLEFVFGLAWSDPAGAQYGPTATDGRSQEVLPIVPVSLTAPATAEAGTTIGYTVTATNVGSVDAPEVDLTLMLPDGTFQQPVVGSLGPGAVFQTTAYYPIPSSRPGGPIEATAVSIWTDAVQGAYGPLEATASTEGSNPSLFNSLVLAPSLAGPNVTGTEQSLTATLTDHDGVPIPDAPVEFTVTGANSATGSGTTDGAGEATFTYSGDNSGTDQVQATSGSVVSNTASVSWIMPVQAISTSPLLARYFFSNGSGVFNTPPGTEPAFVQAFPTINFNPPGGTVPGNTSGVGVLTRPFTNVTTDLNGNFTGTIVAEGNGLRAGVGSLFNFQAVYTGSFTVASDGNMAITFFSDDGFIIGVGGGATRVSGPQRNVPASGLTPFEQLPVMGAFNAPTAPVAKQMVVHFPGAGSYPYEVDYSECCGGALALTVAAGNISNQGMPPTGSLKLSPLNLTAQPTGGTQTLTVEAFDASGLPVANAGLALIVNGPNARELGAVTDATGTAVFSYSGDFAGTDTAQAIGRVAGLATFSNVAKVPWTVGAGGGGGGGGLPGGNIGPIVTQGWIGSPLVGTTITAPTNITVFGVSLASGILDYWPSSNPEEIKVLNANVTGSGVRGAIDPTVLANDEYTIRLRGTLSDGTQQTSLIVVGVTGDLKPGRVVKVSTDLRIPVVGIPLTLGRRYDSLERGKVEDFGHGWSLQSSVRLEVDKKNNVTFNFNGRRQTFQFKPQPGPFPFPFLLFPRWVPEAGARGTLTGDGCGLLVLSGGTFSCFLDVPGSFAPSNYTYSDPHGREFVMSSDGQLKSVKDLNGNTLTFTPEGIVSSAGGLTVPFERDGEGRITRITDPAGNSYDYGYDANGDLIALQPPGGDPPVQYEYSSDHLLVREIDPRGASTSATYYPDGRLESETDRLGNTTRFAYNVATRTTTTTFPDGGILVRTDNAAGDPVRIQDPIGRITTATYDGNQNLLTVTNALGKTWTYTYDSNGNVISTRDPLGNVVTRNWDARGRLLSMVDPLNRVMTLQYDASSNLSRLSDDLGPIASLTHDTSGNMTSFTLSNGQTAQFSYDAFGNPTGLVDHSGLARTQEFDTFGNLTSMDDGVRDPMTWDYDALGNLVERRDSVGGVLTYDFDANGNRISEEDANGQVWTHEYDAEDRLTATTYPDGSRIEQTLDYAGRPLTTTDGEGNVKSFVWNKAGQVVSATEGFGTPEAATTTYTYDPAGRLNSIVDARNGTTVFTHDDAGRVQSIRDPSGRVTTFHYDAAGQVTSMTRADGLQRQAVYDARGRTIASVNPDGTSIQQVYDGMFLRSVTDEQGRTTSWTYDQHSEVASVTDPLGQVTAYERDARGNLTAVTNANGQRWRYEYDSEDRLVRKILPDGTFEEYTRDLVGHITRLRLLDGNVHRLTWDSMDRLARVDYFDGQSATFTYTATGQTLTATTAAGVTRYEYDSQDRVSRVIQPGGVEISYEYDGSDNLTALTTPRGTSRYTYDALDRMQTVTDPTGGVTTYTYDLGGRLTRRSLPNGVVSDYGYDDRDRLVSLDHHVGAIPSFESFEYTYSLQGQRLSVEEADGTQVFWSYDDASRLVGEVTLDGTGAVVSETTYTYDAAGNRTSATTDGVTTTYQYNALDQLTSAGSIQYSYDGRGNLIRVADGADITTYSYDGGNRLQQAALPNGETASYGYDAYGRLVRQAAGDKVDTYAWDEFSPLGDIVYQSSPAGTSAAYTHGQDQQLVHRLGASSSYYLEDGLGSIVGLTDVAGAETDRYRYDAWGVRTLTTGSTANPFGYRAQWTDGVAELQYLRARHFSPSLGRFLTRDIASFNLYDPVDLNRYTYAASDPINAYDPTGFTAVIEYGGITKEQSENATVEGYLVGRAVQTLLSCALNILLAESVDSTIRWAASQAQLNPFSPSEAKVWQGLANRITIAFGWIVREPLDQLGRDLDLLAAGEEGEKLLLRKAALFKAGPRELAWAMSGKSVDRLFRFLGIVAASLINVEGNFLGNTANAADRCSNHAERKIVRHANPPTNALLSVGASRPVCPTCYQVLWDKVYAFGGCFGPLGGKRECTP